MFYYYLILPEEFAKFVTEHRAFKIPTSQKMQSRYYNELPLTLAFYLKK